MINKWEILTDGGEEIKEGEGALSPEAVAAAEDAKAEGDKGILYPEEKTPEELEAEEKEKAAGGKTEEELAAEAKEAEDKAAKEKEEEGKTEEEKAAEKKVADDKAKADLEAGVVTAENLEFPEGIKINEDIQDKFLKLVNDKDMASVDKAKGFIALQQDLYAAQAEAHQDQINAWEKEVSLDPRFVGDTGDKLDENRALAKKAMDMLNIKGLPELISREQTGLGSHPVIFDLFTTIGRVISEDSFKAGGVGGSGDPKSDKEVLYGKT